VSRRKLVVWIIAGAVASASVAAIVLHMHRWRPRMMTIQGAVVRRDEDTRKELPIGDAEVTASDGSMSASAQSDASGYFRISFPQAVWPGQPVVLSFRHPDYKPLDLKLQTGIRLAAQELFVAAMTPNTQQSAALADEQLLVSNIRVRYTVNLQSEDNIGSAVKTFQVVNRGNVACNGQTPCSPDGNWKASSSTVSLDAGPDNEFRNVRASCIAGPCPFTRIDSSGFVNGGRNISITAVDWSDTATFLLEAEVFHGMVSSNVRELYPVVFGRTLNFTLPPSQEGVSLEADIDDSSMVFPLGPELYLSWADCTVRNNTDPEKTAVYRCELKPGYRF
jgi:hypothetical protein